MDADQAAALIPELLEKVYPGKYRPATGEVIPDYPGGWLLEDDGAFCFLKAAGTRLPFIWIRVGVAIEIPRDDALAYYVATANKDLQAGRAYMRYGEEFALVVVDESIFAAPVSWQFPASVQGVVTRLDFSLEHARDLQHWIFKRFGGRRFAGDDWMHLAPDLEGTVLEKRPSTGPATVTRESVPPPPATTAGPSDVRPPSMASPPSANPPSAGARRCVTGSCSARGIPTGHAKCAECGHTTQLR
jgi:hypothetical protein